MKSRTRTLPAAALLLATLSLAALSLTACEQANPIAARVIGDDVARQTAAFQGATEAKNWRAIADEPVVDCTAEPDACGKLHGMRANACLILAMDARTNPRATCPGASADVSRWLDCADREYAAALPMLAASVRGGAAANRANALYCKAEARTVATGQSDAAAAEQAGTQAATPTGLLWAARGAMFQARRGASGDRCGALRRAAALAGQGAGAGDPTTAAAFTALRADIDGLRPSIPSCAI